MPDRTQTGETGVTRDKAIARGSFSAAENAAIYDKWFAGRPSHFLRHAIAKYGLGRRSVLDVGSCYGHALRRFGPGSMGVEVNEPAALWSRSIGMSVICGDVDTAKLPQVSAVWC